MPDSVMPVVDLHKKFYMEYLSVCGDICCVIFISGEKLIAVSVNGVEQYCDVTDDFLFSLPAILKTGSDPCIQQIINRDGRLIPVLSLQLLLKEIESGGTTEWLNRGGHDR